MNQLRDEVLLLIEDYKRRLKNINELANSTGSNGSIAHQRREERFITKASDYRTIISELERLPLENLESISNPSELSDLTFKSQVALMDSILWIDPKEETDTYDFSTKFLDIKATLYVKLKYDRKDLPDGISVPYIDNVQVSHKTGEPIELTDEQYETLCDEIESKLRLRPIVETD